MRNTYKRRRSPPFTDTRSPEFPYYTHTHTGIFPTLPATRDNPIPGLYPPLPPLAPPRTRRSLTHIHSRCTHTYISIKTTRVCSIIVARRVSRVPIYRIFLSLSLILFFILYTLAFYSARARSLYGRKKGRFPLSLPLNGKGDDRARMMMMMMMRRGVFGKAARAVGETRGRRYKREDKVSLLFIALL